MQHEKTPKVSVCVVTYNQKKYIRQCLQSIVEQVTDFDFEVIVADDCSTDGTRSIVQEFADHYPGVVKPIFHETNIGAYNNFVFVHQQARGEYIAHVDGDDYCLPSKLQTQADQLDKNSDCTICVHEVKRFDQGKLCFIKTNTNKIPRKSDISYLLMNLPFFANSSKMYRSECRNGLEPPGEVIDCYTHIHQALSGNILYLNDVLGVYRLNVGISTATSAIGSAYKRPVPRLLEMKVDSINYASRSGIKTSVIKKAKAKAYFIYSYYCLLAKDFSGFQHFIKKSINIEKIDKMQLIFHMLSSIPCLLYLIVRLRADFKMRYSRER